MMMKGKGRFIFIFLFLFLHDGGRKIYRCPEEAIVMMSVEKIPGRKFKELDAF